MNKLQSLNNDINSYTVVYDNNFKLLIKAIHTMLAASLITADNSDNALESTISKIISKSRETSAEEHINHVKQYSAIKLYFLENYGYSISIGLDHIEAKLLNQIEPIYSLDNTGIFRNTESPEITSKQIDRLRELTQDGVDGYEYFDEDELLVLAVAQYITSISLKYDSKLKVDPISLLEWCRGFLNSEPTQTTRLTVGGIGIQITYRAIDILANKIHSVSLTISELAEHDITHYIDRPASMELCEYFARYIISHYPNVIRTPEDSVELFKQLVKVLNYYKFNSPRYVHINDHAFELSVTYY